MIQSSPLAISGEGAFFYLIGSWTPLSLCGAAGGFLTAFYSVGIQEHYRRRFRPLERHEQPHRPPQTGLIGEREPAATDRQSERRQVLGCEIRKKYFFKYFYIKNPRTRGVLYPFIYIFYIFFYFLYCVAVGTATKLHRPNDRITPIYDKTTPMLRQNYTHKILCLTELLDHKPPAAAAPELRFYCDRLTPNCDKLT